MTERERAQKLAAIEKRTAEAMVAVTLNGRKASEVVCLQLAAESLSCAVMSVHRARANYGAIPKRLRKRIDRLHKHLVNVVMDVAGELSDAITRPKAR